MMESSKAVILPPTKKDLPRSSDYFNKLEIGKINLRTGEELPIITTITYLGRKGYRVDPPQENITHYGVTDSNLASKVQVIIELSSGLEESGK